MITCFILDDEQPAVEVLLHFCRQIDYIKVIGTSNNPLDAMQRIAVNPPDLLFVDIQMPDISGIDLVRNIDKNIKVVFTTAYSEFASLGFELEATDYLLKPIPFPRFLRATQKVLNDKIRSQVPVQEVPFEEDYFFVKTEARGKMLKINMADIDYIEGMKNYVAIYHNGQKTLALLNMKDLEQRLSEKFFLRVQKSFIVPLYKITSVEGNMIRLKNIKSEILMGDTYKTKVLAFLRSKAME